MSTHLIIEQRWKIVHLRQYTHYTLTRIAKEAQCDKATVVRILALHRDTGDVAERAGRGRKRRCTDDALARLDIAYTSTPHATPTEVIDYVANHTSVYMSPSTMRRERKRLGYYRVKERVVQELSAANIAKRLTFTRAHLHDTWHTTIFSDEKLFAVGRTSNRMWKKSDTAMPTRTVKMFRSQVMVWGGIWYNGRTQLAVVEGNINAQVYQDTLRDYLLPSIAHNSRMVFQQDNASAHTAATTQEWLREFAVPMLSAWPPFSPDLNPIESVWSWMTHRVNGERPRTVQELKDAINHAWDEMPQSVIQSHIDHLPHVFRAVYDNDGNRA